MKTAAKLLCASFMLLALPQVVEGASSYSKSEPQGQETLYIIKASSGTFNEDLLTINSVPEVIFYSSLPNKQAGHVAAKDFVENWDQLVKSDGTTHMPNATLTLSSPSGNDNVTVVLSEPKFVNGNLTYKTDIVEGEIPNSFSSGSLFIEGMNAPSLNLH